MILPHASHDDLGVEPENTFVMLPIYLQNCNDIETQLWPKQKILNAPAIILVSHNPSQGLAFKPLLERKQWRLIIRDAIRDAFASSRRFRSEWDAFGWNVCVLPFASVASRERTGSGWLLGVTG
jgi:hypothetical protein